MTKFSRVFRAINEIDFGDNKINNEKELSQFADQLKLNK